MDNSQAKASHILNTSSNLLGLCFVVLTYIKVLKLESTTLIDEITTVAIVLFMSSSLLSFMAIRSKDNSPRYENLADYVFLSGLLLLFGTTLFIAFNIIK